MTGWCRFILDGYGLASKLDAIFKEQLTLHGD